MADNSKPHRSPSDAAVSVVVPVLNEAGNIRPLVAEIEAALSGIEGEILYVDDGSDDATPTELAAAAADYSRLRSVRHRRPSGQSAAVASGVQAARHAIIATLDGDGQNDPADIPKLLAAYTNMVGEGGPLMVAGHRVHRRDTWIKRLSSKIANGVRRRLLGDDTPDTGCGLKVFGRDAFLDLPRFNHMHRFLPALMIRQGGRVVSVAVSHRARARGASKYGVLDRLFVGIADIRGVMWLSRRPLNPEIEASSTSSDQEQT